MDDKQINNYFVDNDYEGHNREENSKEIDYLEFCNDINDTTNKDAEAN